MLYECHSPRWIWLFAVTCQLTGVILWVVFGKIPSELHGEGIFLSEARVELVDKLIRDSIIEHRKLVDDANVVFHKKLILFQNGMLTLQQISQAREDYQRAKSELIKAQNAEYVNEDIIADLSEDKSQLMLVGVVYADDGATVKPGMSVNLSLPYQYRNSKKLHGVVTYISYGPVSKSILNGYVNNKDLADKMWGQAIPYLVKIKIFDDINHEYKPELTSGMMMKVDIIAEYNSPFDLLFK